MKFYSGKNTEVPALHIEKKNGTEALAILDCEMARASVVAKSELALLPFCELRAIKKAQAVRLDLFGGYHSNYGGEWTHEDPNERKGFYEDLIPDVMKMLSAKNEVKCYKLTYVLPNDRITEYWYEGELPTDYFHQAEEFLNGHIIVKCAEEDCGWTLLVDDPTFITDRVLGSNGDDINNSEFESAIKELNGPMFSEITLKSDNGHDVVIERCESLPEIDIERTIEDNFWGIPDFHNIFIHGKNLHKMFADGEI